MANNLPPGAGNNLGGNHQPRPHLPGEILRIIFTNLDLVSLCNSYIAFEHSVLWRMAIRPKITQALSLRPRHSDFNTIPQPHARTSGWIYNSPQYKKWVDTESDDRLLKIEGMQESGKSTLLLSIYEESQRQHHRRIGYICNTGLAALNLPLPIFDMYESLVGQLVPLFNRLEWVQFVQILTAQHQDLFQFANFTVVAELNRLFVLITGILTYPVYCYIDDLHDYAWHGGNIFIRNQSRMSRDFRLCIAINQFPHMSELKDAPTITLNRQRGQLKDAGTLLSHHLQVINAPKRHLTRLQTLSQGHMAWVDETRLKIIQAGMPVTAYDEFEQSLFHLFYPEIGPNRQVPEKRLLSAFLLYGQYPLRWEDYYLLHLSDHKVLTEAWTNEEMEFLRDRTDHHLRTTFRGLVKLDEDGNINIGHNSLLRYLTEGNRQGIPWLIPLAQRAYGYRLLRDKWARFKEKTFKFGVMTFPRYAEKQVRYCEINEKRR